MAAFQTKLIDSYGGSLDLADGINYSIDDDQASQFNVPAEDGIGTITETLIVNVLGGSSSNPAVRRKVAADNLNALTSMLRRINAHQAGQYGYIALEIVPPNSNPPKKFFAALLKWQNEEYLPDILTASNLPDNAVNQITIVYTRRTPWDWQWLNDNEVAATQSMSGITSVQNGLSRSTIGGAMVWGGVGYGEWTKTSDLAANMYLSNVGYGCTNGAPVTFSCTLSHTNLTSLDVQLISIGPVTGRSNVVAATLTSYTDAIANGVRFTANLTPTFTGTLYPYFQVGGLTGATLRITEPMFQAGTVDADDTAWHLSQGLEIRPASASAASFVPATPTFYPGETALSPTALSITLPSSYQPTSGLIAINNASIFTGMNIGNLPSGAGLASGFSSFAEPAGNRAMNNNLLRCTASAATTYVQPLGYSSAYGSRCALAIALRNNAATNQWIVSVRVKPSTTATNYFESRPIFPINDNQCRIYVLGELSAPFTWGQIELVVASNTASGTIDFDWLMWNVVDENSCLITHGGAPAALTSINVVPYTARGYALINGGEITPYDDPLFMTKATNLHVAYLAPTATTWSPPAGNISYTLARYSAAEHVS